MPKSSSRKSRLSVAPGHATPKTARRATSSTPRPGHAKRPGNAPRAAYARPAVLGVTMLLLLAASLLWAIAANTVSAVKAKPTPTPKPAAKPTATKTAASPALGKAKHLDWSDLPALMKAYGAKRKLAALGTTNSRVTTKRFSLTESDLTSNTPGDERDPSYSANGNLITFSSNSTAVNATTHTTLGGPGTPLQPHYHVWIMNSDGSGQTQITGLTTSGPNEDDNRDQMAPSWDPSGTQIVYTDYGVYPNEANNLQQTAKTELFIVTPFSTSGTPANPTRLRLTTSGGTKLRPVFNSSGSAIAFASNVDPRIDNTVTAGHPQATYVTLTTFDIFTITPDGSEANVTRVTGTTTPLASGTRTDATGDTVGDSTDDLNPAYSQVTSNLIFFSSNRDGGGMLGTGRRIWATTTDGTARRQVTDPTTRAAGLTTDVDDYPAPSSTAGSFTERLGFQTNSSIDTSDTVANGGYKDLNIWSLAVNSNQVIVPPALVAGSFGTPDEHLHKYTYPTGISQGYFNPNQLAQFEDVLFGSASSNQLFASERIPKTGAPRVEVFDSALGTDLGAFTPTTGANAVAAPTGLAFSNGGNLYVADSSPVTTTVGATTTTAYYVRRFDGAGNPRPGTSGTQTGSIFTDGGGTSAASAGLEGLALGPDDTGDGTPELFVSSLNDGILEYNGRTGAFLRTVVPIGPTTGSTPDPNGLKTPTGIAFGPDGDLYVCSQQQTVNGPPVVPGIDAIKRYAPTTYNAMAPAGTNTYSFVSNFVSDTNGANHNLNDPERLRFGPDGNLYVSDYTADNDATTNTGTGDHISRYYGPNSTTGTPGADYPNPQLGLANNKAIYAIDVNPNDPIYGNNPSNTPLYGPSGFDFNPSARGNLPSVESTSASEVETNLTSSPNGFTNSQLTTTDSTGATIGEDKSADREPGFSGRALTRQQTANLTFASQRRTAAAPGTVTTAGSTDTRPLVVNPYGGSDTLTGQVNNYPVPPSGQVPPTHDIWGTTAEGGDFTPPTLLAQSVGNLKYPVIAPGPQAPVVADPAALGTTAAATTLRSEINGQYRTYESGLRPYNGTPALGNQVTIGVVMQDLESGLNTNANSGAVTANIKDADQTQFDFHTPSYYVYDNGQPGGVDASVPVATASEKFAPNDHVTVSTVKLQPYDDGPPRYDTNGNYLGGHELEAGAVAGDGIYYCAGTTSTPATTGGGDYYIDITAQDKAGNSFLYDNVWGFSTRQFVKSNGGNLFVSDYTAGQLFPYALASDVRYENMVSVESYFLNNPGDSAAASTATGVAVVGTQNGVPLNPTIPNADTWRILCRGAVPQTVLNSYAPTVTFQLDAADFASGLPTDYPNHAKTKRLGVATSDVVWGAPYAGLVFAGPGTIYDATTQTTISQFLDTGGRFFLSGQDVLFSLSGQGTQTNTFLQNELRATYSGETNPTVLNVNTAFPITFLGGDLDNLHIPVNGDPNNTYTDAATNRRGTIPNSNTGTGGNGGGLDTMTSIGGTSSLASATTVFNAYTGNGSNVGQYIKQTRTSNGQESRVAFFGFGLEQIDRRYVAGTPNYTVSERWRVCRNLLDKFFDTTSITGKVVDATTNQGVPNFLVQAVFTPSSNITGTTQKFIAQTDSSGNYSFLGIPTEIPSDNYTVRPALDGSGKSLNLGYRGGTPVNLGGNVFGTVQPGVANFLVTPIPPGTITGYVYSTNGTVVATTQQPDPRSDDTPLPNVPVLVKTGQLGVYPGFPNGGEFAELVTTNASGRFTASNVPASDATNNVLIPITVILNPDEYLETETDPKTQAPGDIPANSGINYGRIGTNATVSHRTDLRRRVLPDSNRPTIIYAPAGDTFFLNDDDPTDPTSATRLPDSGTPLLLPKGPGVSGTVFLNGTVLAGATVTITVPGEAAPRTATTSSNGSYSFFDVPVGTYQITAIAPSPYTASTYFVTVTIATADANDIADANIFLTKQDIIGTLTLTGGPNSPAGFTVTLYQNGVAVPGSVASPNPVAITAVANPGTFVFYDVAPGTYTIIATNGLLTQTQTVVVPQPRQNANPVPGPVPTATAIPTGFDVNVTFQFFVRAISGTVTLNGVPVQGASVQLLASDGTTAIGNPILSAADGSFTFATVTAPGTYYIRATITVGLGTDTNISSAINLPTASDVTGVVIPLFLETIAGKVTLNGAVLSGAPVQLSQGGKLLASTTTSSDGSYSFADLSPGTYTLTSSYGGDTASVSVTVKRATAVNQVIVIAPTIPLLLETITGRVTLNGVPFEGATVYLFDANGKVLATTSSTAGGIYQFVNQPAGNYTLEAVASATQLRALGAGTGDTTQISITVTRGVNAATPAVPDLMLLTASITGRVLLNGKPTQGATVQLVQNDTILKTLSTNSNGLYTFSNLLPGTYTIQASQGGDTAQISVTVTRGQNVTPSTVPDLRLDLEFITGRVALNSVLLKGATVILMKGAFTLGRTTTDAAGSYTFTGLLPGAYRVRAFYGGDEADVVSRVTRGVNVSNPTIRLFLETLTGRVTLNGKPVSGVRVTLVQNSNGRSLGTVTTTAAGTYSYSKLPSGVYTITASTLGLSVTTQVTVVRGKNLAVPDIALKIETVSGQVLLNGKPLNNAAVVLLNTDDSPVSRTTTDTAGHYSFKNVPAGAYIVRVTTGGNSQDTNITVRLGINLTVPAINIVTATPTPVVTPTPTPVPTGVNTYSAGQTYQISIPYMDSTAPNATTTPAKAFNLPPLQQDGTQNYHIFSYNAQTEKYVELSNTSLLSRGVGYFLQPVNDVSLNDPASDPTRKPTSATSFTVTLYNNPSLSARDPHNGFNLIGSPFNPAVYSGADFLNSEVITPDGHVYPTVSAAVAGLVLSPNLFTYDETSGNYTVVNGSLSNFQGYYVRTYVNGVKLVLRPSK